MVTWRTAHHDDGGKKGKKERASKEERPAPTLEVLQGVLSAPISPLPIALDSYLSLIDAKSRSLLTSGASEPRTSSIHERLWLMQLSRSCLF